MVTEPAYAALRQDLLKILQGLQNLPDEHKKFYEEEAVMLHKKIKELDKEVLLRAYTAGDIGMSKPAAVIGPNTIGGGELTPPEYNETGKIDPPLTHKAATVRLWFRSWEEAQEFVKGLKE